MRTVHLSRNKPCELGRRPAIEVELLVDMVSDGARFDRSECIRQPNVDSAMLALSSTKSGTSQRTSSSSSMNIVKRSTKVIIGVERRWRVVSWRSLEEHTMVMIDSPSSFPFTPVTRRREKRTDRFFVNARAPFVFSSILRCIEAPTVPLSSVRRSHRTLQSAYPFVRHAVRVTLDQSVVNSAQVKR